jgi:hypothetical protein
MHAPATTTRHASRFRRRSDTGQASIARLSCTRSLGTRCAPLMTVDAAPRQPRARLMPTLLGGLAASVVDPIAISSAAARGWTALEPLVLCAAAMQGNQVHGPAAGMTNQGGAR